MADEEKRPEGVESDTGNDGSEAESAIERMDAASGSEQEGNENRPEKGSADTEKGGEQGASGERAATPDSRGNGGHGSAEPGEHGHAGSNGDGHSNDSHHGLAHTASIQLLVGVFAALTVLTIITVAVTAVDLGSQGNFIVAMIIATIKAGLVMAFFMHMLWDRAFNVLVFVSSFLFVLLFLTFALADRSEYQWQIDTWETAHAEDG